MTDPIPDSRADGSREIPHLHHARHPGSFNISAAAATRKAENVLLLWNVPELAAQYERKWQRLWDESTDVKAHY